MKKQNVKRRLTLHFTYQMLLLFVFVLLGVLAVLFVMSQSMINEDMKRRFPVGALELIIIETYLNEGKANVPARWEKQLVEQHYWLQVVNSEGQVTKSINAPDDLPQSYGSGELLTIQKTKRFGTYDVLMSLDDTYLNENTYLFMLGYMNEGAIDLQNLYDQYAKDGMVKEGALGRLDEELKASSRTLQVMTTDGQVRLSVGLPMERTAYNPLELLMMEEAKGSYPTSVSVYAVPESHTYWVLHESKNGEYVQYPLMKSLIIILVSLGGVVLLTTLVFSIYHGYRYGRPLLLFIDWFERLGKGQYDATVSKKDRKQIYRKNGLLRGKYKLYKEVIDGFSDMTARLHASEQDRTRLEKTREEWMTGISHDLRTPLSSIQGYGHLLESGQYSFTEEELKEMGGTIRDKSDYMIDLIQDFSLAFQLKNKQVPFTVKPIELQEFVRRIVLNYVNDMTMEGTTFQYENEESETTSIRVLANDKWFARMLDNIMINAVRHNPEGTIITVRVALSGDYAVLTVEDDGIGMDEETLLNLFERYYRGTNTEEKTGAGLGMSIAKSIVLAHNGTIKAESEVGRGTTVTISLPILLGSNVS
ncbi:sensor histidine kinase [Paenibacillus paeoniae]|uniref:histidine kinase n=1 Tax=Paenibacillus paeoniae TaxID=2292705 RepID=A0A371PEC6_9BACL|nr:HAMP domain-containing sensor histidine kinase [Paenibacillus paeoniae]REK74303.1 sensor histidine kinase [Paenibacillus paeoniae]